MEAMVVSRAQSSALLLEHAFGKRLVNGEDEWCGVDSVVRSSFLLLYREFRRQEKRLRILVADHHPVIEKPTEDGRLPLVYEQIQLLSEELQLVKSELRELRVNGASCKCRCEDSKALVSQQVVMTKVAVQTQRQWHRHQQLRHTVSKLQHQVRGIRRVQHECEEIVVRTAETQQRQTQSLFKKVSGEAHKRERLEENLETRVKPRLKLLEKHVVAMHRKLKKGTRREDTKEEEQETGGAYENEQIEQDAVKVQAPLHLKHQSARSLQASYRSPPLSPVFASRGPLHCDFADQHLEEEDEEDELLYGRPNLAVPAAHASLRLRYQHERKRQIKRLDRLRHTKIVPRSLAQPQHEERGSIQ